MEGLFLNRERGGLITPRKTSPIQVAAETDTRSMAGFKVGDCYAVLSVSATAEDSKP